MTSKIVKIFFVSGLLSFAGFANAAEEFVLVAGYQLEDDGSKMSESEARDKMNNAAELLENVLFTVGRTMDSETAEELNITLFPNDTYLLESRGDGKTYFRNHDEIVKKLSSSNKAMPYVIYFTTEAMRMNTPEHSMVWRLGKDGSTAYMAFADHAKKEVTDLTNLSNPALNIMAAKYSGLESSSTGKSEEMLGVDTAQYGYSFSVTMEGGFSIGNILPNLGGSNATEISSKTSGVAWVSKNIPGYDIIKQFFSQFARSTETQNQGLMNSAIAGFVRSMSDMINLGFPLKDSRFMMTTGPSSPMGPQIMLPTINANQVVDVKALPLTDSMANYIGGGKFPDDYTIVDPMKTEDGKEVKFEMPPEVKEMLDNMTPEQRKMMESMGLDKMMQQMMK